MSSLLKTNRRLLWAVIHAPSPILTASADASRRSPIHAASFSTSTPCLHDSHRLSVSFGSLETDALIARLAQDESLANPIPTEAAPARKEDRLEAATPQATKADFKPKPLALASKPKAKPKQPKLKARTDETTKGWAAADSVVKAKDKKGLGTTRKARVAAQAEVPQEFGEAIKQAREQELALDFTSSLKQTTITGEVDTAPKAIATTKRDKKTEQRSDSVPFASKPSAKRTSKQEKPISSRTPSSPPSPSPLPSTPPPPQPQRLAWQTQKAALSAKFGPSTPWDPRKKLSPDAQAGIRDLHASDPERYSTPLLAQQFKVSAEAIRRILKSKWATQQPGEKLEERRERWARRHDRIWDQQAQLGLRPARTRERKVEDPDAFEAEMRAKQILEDARNA